MIFSDSIGYLGALGLGDCCCGAAGVNAAGTDISATESVHMRG